MDGKVSEDWDLILGQVVLIRVQGQTLPGKVQMLRPDGGDCVLGLRMCDRYPVSALVVMWPTIVGVDGEWTLCKSDKSVEFDVSVRSHMRLIATTDWKEQDGDLAVKTAVLDRRWNVSGKTTRVTPISPSDLICQVAPHLQVVTHHRRSDGSLAYNIRTPTSEGDFDQWVPCQSWLTSL